MPNLTPLIFFAALVSVPILAFVAWIGLLFHRVLKLPTDQQQHGVAVLKQLTALVRASAPNKITNGQPTRRRRPRTSGPRNEGRS